MPRMPLCQQRGQESAFVLGENWGQVVQISQRHGGLDARPPRAAVCFQLPVYTGWAGRPCKAMKVGGGNGPSVHALSPGSEGMEDSWLKARPGQGSPLWRWKSLWGQPSPRLALQLAHRPCAARSPELLTEGESFTHGVEACISCEVAGQDCQHKFLLVGRLNC